ncbi:MAG: PAS domain-containing protein [Acidobacteriia bacterium]|nr:PAS domain-containing protein [Terriglobia bacterium]
MIRTLAHTATTLSYPVLMAGNIHLVDRRGKQGPIDPRRQVEISTLLESIPEAAVIVDNNGRIVDANSVTSHLVGRTREELRGMVAEETGLLAKAEDDSASEPIVQRALSGQTVRHDRRVLRDPKTGVVNELLVSANPILDEQGQPIAALLIARDVTELTQLQRRIADIERHRAIGEMAAALAHDFNNILDTIAQAAAVLETSLDRPASERKPLLDMIHNTVRRGAEMVQRIREYLRTGEGASRPIDVCTIIAEAVELTRPLWQKANAKVTTSLTPVPNVSANAADLRRVFTNLIINAIEAMPPGGRVAITCGPHENQVVATVSDTGIGIPPADQKRVFFAYFTTKPRGTGLGLSGAQKILLSYGGNISFHSEPGKGTTFTIVLPAASG